MIIHPMKTVREIVLGVGDAAGVFDELHIDYCCRGAKTLADACAEVGVPMAVAVTLLEHEAEHRARPPEAAWVDAPLAELVDFVQHDHYAFTREKIAALAHRASNVRRAHGAAHPELVRVEELVCALVRELAPHIDQEERVVFPAIRALPEDSAIAPELGALVHEMVRQHEGIGALLRQLHGATADYLVPSDATPPFESLYEDLAALEREVRHHVHLENNVVFPRALALAGEPRSSWYPEG